MAPGPSRQHCKSLSTNAGQIGSHFSLDILGKSTTLPYVSTTMPGQVWSRQLPDSSTLCLFRVCARQSRPETFVLAKDRLPIAPPYVHLKVALAYVRQEWCETEHQGKYDGRIGKRPIV